MIESLFDPDDGLPEGAEGFCQPCDLPRALFALHDCDFPDDMPVGEAREKMNERVWQEGQRCPVCIQWAKVYRWRLYATAARFLVRLYRAGGTDTFVESKTVKVPGQGGDATRLRHWRLVEHEKERRPDGGRSGFWRVTERGERFVRGEIAVPKYAYTYDGRCLLLNGDPGTISDVLGESFDYADYVRVVAAVTV
jgi:hypothetical protein